MAENLVRKLMQINENPLNFLGLKPVESFYVTPPKEIRNIISNLPLKYSTGTDGIPSFLLKTLPLNVLTILTNSTYLISTGHFISSFKISKVIPILKKGNPRLAENYRPISLLPVFFSKI